MKSLSLLFINTIFSTSFKKFFWYSSNYGMLFLSLFEIGFETNQKINRGSFLNEREEANESDH
ncbi:hypothetical protein CTV99_04190 [Bacillus pumilus]|uniref:Uncharacterized protein n=1 Tax=Bacillus pumilus TaxID=1408 RepID=A0A2G8IWX5_BACPU|nr:hypothetical protein CTV99_04190 [Bacillus pumilus]